MKEKLKFIMAFMIIILFLPYVCVILLHSNVQAESTFLSTTAEEENADVEVFIPGVLAAQVSPSSEPEMLKVQAVIARTQIYKMMEEEGITDLEAKHLSQYMSMSEMEKIWGYHKMQEYYSKFKQAAQETSGIVMKYQGQYIEPCYHAVSNGNSRDGNQVYHSENYPYLQSVENPYDILSENYLKVTMLDKKRMAEKLSEVLREEISEELMSKIEISDRDDVEYITKVKIGEHIMAGEEFRKVLELNSACFEIEEVNGKIRITTKGLGHGIGLSQFNANEMAKNGEDYKTILSYYFKNIEFISE